MVIRKLILGRNNEETSFIFDKQVNIIDDLALSKELGTENIKNEDSTLILKSMSDTQIADVIQIKINLTAVGCLLVNFSKDSLTEENRKNLLDQLSALKDKVQETQETQEVKFRKILCIIEQFNPIYVTFLNDLEFKIDSNKIAKEVEWSFPLIVLAVAPKQPSFFEKVKSFKLMANKSLGQNFLTNQDAAEKIVTVDNNTNFKLEKGTWNGSTFTATGEAEEFGPTEKVEREILKLIETATST